MVTCMKIAMNSQAPGEVKENQKLLSQLPWNEVASSASLAVEERLAMEA